MMGLFWNPYVILRPFHIWKGYTSTSLNFSLEKGCLGWLAGWVSECQHLYGVVIQLDELNMHLEEVEYIFNC